MVSLWPLCMYVRLLYTTIRTNCSSCSKFTVSFSCSHRVFEFLEAQEMEDESHKIKELKDVKGKVEFKNVTFTI